MKIMFYINTISYGGAERVMVNLATKLSETGNECVLVTSFKEKEFEFKVGAKVLRISLTKERLKNKLFRNITYTRLLRKNIKKYKPNVIISFMPEANYRTIIAKLGSKTKSIISVRNDPNREYASLLSKILAKTLYRLSNGIVFQTEDAQRWFPKSIQNKSRIIYNQVDDKFYNVNYKGERKNIVATGRLDAQKNQRMLIDAYANICGTTEDKLLIYGVGNLHDTLENQIKAYHLEDKVILKGGSSDVPNDIKSAKLYVMSSDFEGMPNALMEAMALGLPCISTDCPCGGPRMLFGETLKDCLVPVNNANAMANKIKELLLDNNKREIVAQLSKQQAEAFRPQVIIKQWEEYIKSVIK